MSKSLTGAAGEYYVAAELSRRGYLAALTIKNSPIFDILATTLDGTRQITVQVKTSEIGRRWPLNKKVEKPCPNLYYILVRLFPDINKRPEYFIIDSVDLSTQVRTGHAEWLANPDQNGQSHKDSNMRMFRDLNGLYLERWEILEQAFLCQ